MDEDLVALDDSTFGESRRDLRDFFFKGRVGPLADFAVLRLPNQEGVIGLIFRPMRNESGSILACKLKGIDGRRIERNE